MLRRSGSVFLLVVAGLLLLLVSLFLGKVGPAGVQPVAAADPISSVGTLVTGTIRNSSAATLVLTTTAGVAAGDDIIIAYASDPNQDLNISVSDSAGNTYQQAGLAIAVGSGRLYVFAAYSVTALSSGSYIYITQVANCTTAVTARAAVVSVFRGLANEGALEQNCVAAGTSTTPSSGNATTVMANQLLIGAVLTEGPNIDSAGTWQNSFTAGPRAGTNGAGNDTDMTVSMGWRIVSASGAYSASISGITSRDWAAAIVTFKNTGWGISYIGDIGNAHLKVAGTTLAVTTTAAVAGGDDVLVAFAADPIIRESSATDSVGNTYTRVVSVTNGTTSGSNVVTNIFAAYNVTALPSGSFVTINHTSVTARAAVVSVFRNLADINVLDRTQTGTGSGSPATSGATSTTTQADELLIGVVGDEGPNYDAPSVWVNSFTYGPRRGTTFGTCTGGGDTDITAQLGWRIVGSTGAYTAQIINYTTVRDWAAAIATFKGYGPTYVSLRSFTADAGRGPIRLAWDTAGGAGSLGFHIYRAGSANGERERLTANLIPSQAPGSASNSLYQFVDETAQPGLTYYYWIEQVGLDGAAQLHGPISARASLFIKVPPPRN